MSNSEHPISATLSTFENSNQATTDAVLVGGKPKDTDMVHPLAYGAGIAVQSVSQSVAIAVQDASDFMRDIGTIESTAIGVATKKMIAEKNPLYIPIIEACQKVMTDASEYWLKVGKDGAQVLSAYQKVINNSSSES